jgi:hypothetical protein
MNSTDICRYYHQLLETIYGAIEPFARLFNLLDNLENCDVISDVPSC